MVFFNKSSKSESETTALLSKEEIVRIKDELRQMELDMISTNMAAIITAGDQLSQEDHRVEIKHLKERMTELSMLISASEEALKQQKDALVSSMIVRSMAAGACIAVGVGLIGAGVAGAILFTKS